MCFDAARTSSAVFVRDRIEPASRFAGVKPQAVCRVACLEWNLRIGEPNARRCGHSAMRYCLLKYFLQKRLRDGETAVENT
jgi:hypothetical protein